MFRHQKVIQSSMVLLIALAGCASAQASGTGAWRLNPALCPDLVEDYVDRRESRLDRRVNRGPLDRLEDRVDRRESRRDERVTVCPASAWVWDGPRRARVARPAATAVYYDVGRRNYFRYGPRRTRVTVVVR
ncbi:MAG: hypothetical protein AAF668_05320 [Pseudomonadota bacterium]